METEIKTDPAQDEPALDDVMRQAAASGAPNTRAKPPEPAQLNRALEWFLSDDDSGDATRTLEVNVGTGSERRIPWTIRAVDLDTLRRIRRKAAGSRAQRRAGEDLDEDRANLEIVLEGTVDPDIREAASQLGIASPLMALETRFSHKPGLLGQIAGEIMSLSGYDDEDVREAAAVRG